MEETHIGVVSGEFESLTILGIREDVSRIMTYFIHEDVDTYIILTRMIR